ncbi:MAG: hypothetical protein HQK53_18925 [Oligoflexia bacterium]|nr:hypothetical protein [Oligoflexia bacterium]
MLGTLTVQAAASQADVTADAIFDNVGLLSRYDAVQQEVAQLLKGDEQRPKNCPLKSVEYRELVQQLKEIYNKLQDSKCLDKNKSSIEGLGLIGSGLSSDLEKFMSLKLASSASVADQLEVQKVQNLLHIFVNLSKDRACLDDIRSKGVMPLISDIILGFSVLGANNSQSGSLYTLPLGLGFNSLLKIILSMSERSFDWSKEGDRHQFISLVCSFYDLRRVVERLKIARIPSDKDYQELRETEAMLALIERTIVEVEDMKQHLPQIISLQQNRYISIFMDKNKLELLESLHDLKVCLATAGGKALELNISLRKELPSKIAHIGALLQKVTVDFSHYPLLNVEGAYQRLLSNDYSAFRDISDSELVQYYLQPVNILEDVLVDERAPYLQSWNEIAFPAATNSTNLQKTRQAEMHLVELINQLEQGRKELSFIAERLRGLLTRADFSAADDGEHNRFSLMQEYEKVGEMISGKTSLSFLNYILENGREFLSAFFYGYDNLVNERKYVAVERTISCASAQLLLNKYISAKALSEMGADYFYATQDIFSADIFNQDSPHMVPVGYSSLVIPIKNTSRDTLLYQLQSFIKVKRLLADKKMASALSVGELLQRIDFEKFTIGDYIKIISASKKMALRIQRYLDENCSIE